MTFTYNNPALNTQVAVGVEPDLDAGLGLEELEDHKLNKMVIKGQGVAYDRSDH